MGLNRVTLDDGKQTTEARKSSLLRGRNLEQGHVEMGGAIRRLGKGGGNILKHLKSGSLDIMELVFLMTGKYF